MTEITKILQNLIELTKSDEIVWTVSNSIFNNDTSRRFETKSFDNITEFKLEIRLKDDFSYSYSDFHTHNPDLINGYDIFYNRDYEDIEKLGKIVFQKYYKPTIQPKNVKKTYGDILDGMASQQVIRDRKLNSILDGGKSIFDKILGR